MAGKLSQCLPTPHVPSLYLLQSRRTDVSRDGKFIATLRGHVGSVYACAFSADSRLLVSASKDHTLKIWSVDKTGKLAVDLPGHQDEVYAVDWSPDGQKVGSGGKDKAVRLWRN